MGKKNKPESSKADQVEISKRSSAGLAKTTQGRARTISDKKTVYDRKKLEKPDASDSIQ
jgi:hypothetical protein